MNVTPLSQVTSPREGHINHLSPTLRRAVVSAVPGPLASRNLAGTKVVLRLDGHLVHVVHNGVLAKTLPSPIPADQRTKIRGARVATTQLPPPQPGPISVQRKVPTDGVVMVARQRLRIGRTYAGNIVTIHVEDTHFRVTCDGAELAIHPRNGPSQTLESQNPRSPNLI